MKSRTRVRVSSFLENVSGIGIKLGTPALALGLAYMLYLVFGHRLAGMASMKQADQTYMIQTVCYAGLLLKIGAVALATGLAIRFFYQENIGQMLALIGGAVYFFGPALITRITGGTLIKVPLYAEVVNEIAFVGLACLPAGGILLIRGMIERIQRCLARRIAAGKTWGDEEERIKVHRTRKRVKLPLPDKCWEMAFCRDFVRDVCPAWRKKKPCWRVKSGCYCDEGTILKAMTAGTVDNIHARGFLESLTSNKGPKLSAKQKRIRCRRCMIYTEHQRQKYRLLSPLVFPLVGLMFVVFYGPIAAVAWNVLEKTDRFVSFLTYQTASQNDFASSGSVVTALAVIWLATMVLNYTIRVLEWLVFDLQV